MRMLTRLSPRSGATPTSSQLAALWALAVAMTVAACGDDGGTPSEDAGADARPGDGSAPDASIGDGGMDATVRDAGARDASMDGSATDAALADAGGPDAALDAGTVDGGMGSDGAAADASADAGPSCTVGTSAYPTVQSALDDAACPRVRIPAAEYFGPFTISRSVEVIGDGTTTRLSGDAASRTVSIDGDVDVTFTDIQIEAGLADVGAGIRYEGASSLVLRRVTVIGNVLEGEDARGAGLYVRNGDVTLEGATFTANGSNITDSGFRIASGGAIYLRDATLTADADTVIEQNDLLVESPDETSVTRGGGIAVAGSSVATLNGTTIRDNSAVSRSTTTSERADADGGGIWCGSGASVTLGIGTVVQANEVTAEASMGALDAEAQGAGVYANGCTVRLDQATVTQNLATATGASSVRPRAAAGGVMVEAGSSLEVDESSIINNQAQASTSGSGTGQVWGGGLLVWRAMATVRTTTIHNNAALGFGTSGATGRVTARGGGVHVANSNNPPDAIVRIERSTLSNNFATTDSSLGGDDALAAGGGLYAAGTFSNSTTTVDIVNSTVSGNVARCRSGSGGALCDRASGGGVHLVKPASEAAELNLFNVTITNNTVDGLDGSFLDGEGGGLLNDDGAVVVANTILSGNVSPSNADCATNQPLTSQGYNLVEESGSCSFGGDDLVGMGAMLSALGDNGGPTETHALTSGSPAVDAANPAGCSDASGALTVDQRGEPRDDARCDIGSFEL